MSDTTQQEEHTITLEGDLGSNKLPVGACTCGKSSWPSANLLELGKWAVQHSKDNPGHNLRKHDV